VRDNHEEPAPDGGGAAKELNTLIEGRAREVGEANAYAEAWAEDVRAYNLAAAAARREQWRRFHERMEMLHARLADEHGLKAAELAEDG
jgi:hypothetical protein